MPLAFTASTSPLPQFKYPTPRPHGPHPLPAQQTRVTRANQHSIKYLTYKTFTTHKIHNTQNDKLTNQ